MDGRGYLMDVNFDQNGMIRRNSWLDMNAIEGIDDQGHPMEWVAHGWA